MGINRRGLTSDLVPYVEERLGLTSLQVAFQPIFDLCNDSKPFAYEALMRSDDERFVDPPEVIRSSIDRDVCGELGRLMRHLAVEQCRDHPIFLNVHPHEFEDGWLVRPDDPIFRHDHPIYLEITESVPLSHENHCRGTLSEVRANGARLAVDDLGAGYSNLLYIAELEPEIVKLDAGLARAIVRNERSERLVARIVDLCRDMGAEVVAEGIETRDQLDAVVRAGCRYGQGFFLGRPQRADLPSA
jgi:EAL domain-containing protein (putative c-di-GMP-specific phosphodiesterase class I)